MTDPNQPLAGDPPGGRYDLAVLGVTTILTVFAIAVGTTLFPPIGLAVPLVLVVASVFISSNNSPRRRSIVAGIVGGSGIGLFVSAGICIRWINEDLDVAGVLGAGM